MDKNLFTARTENQWIFCTNTMNIILTSHSELCRNLPCSGLERKVWGVAGFFQLCWTWPEQWVTGGLSGNCRKVPPGAKGHFPRRRAVGEKHLPSPSSNSFFAWLLILTSLIGAVCFVEWVTPPGWNGMCSSANMSGTRFFGGLKAVWEWCVRQKYTDGHNLLYPSDLFFF